MSKRIPLHPLARALAVALASSLPAWTAAADAASTLAVDDAPLPRCLEQIAAATGARFIVSPALAQAAPRCRPVAGTMSAARALDAALGGRDVAWRLREDGVYLVVAAAPVSAGTLDTLAVTGVAPPGELHADASPDAPLRPAIADLGANTRYTREELAAKPFVRFNQLSRLAPNVYSSGESLSIRGVPRDNDYFTGNGVFLDGIDVGTLLLDHNLLTVDGLETLQYERGATGFTLGSGMAGGAIRLDTPLPSPVFGLQARAGAGQRSSATAGLAVGGPLLPNGELSGRVAASTREEPRFMRSAVVAAIDGETDRRDNAHLRLRWEPESLPGFSLDLSGFHVEGDAPDRTVARRAGSAPTQIFDRVSFDPTALDYDLVATGLGLRADYGSDDGLRLQAWASDLDAEREALDRVFADGRTFRGDEEQRTRAGVGLGLPFGGGWQLFGGIETQRVERAEFLLREQRNLPIVGGQSDELTQNILDLDNRALLAELSWTGGPWRVAAGVRGIDEDVEFRFRQRLVPPDGAVVDRITRRTETDYRRALPAGALEHALSPAQSIGASLGRAYRSGGFSEIVFIGEYAPEKLDTAELWWRGRFIHDRVNLRASVFRTDWSDRSSIDGTIGAEIVEPFETRIDGAELELQARLGESWSLRGGLGVLDARHVSGSYRLAPGGVLELEGRRANDAPRYTALLGATWSGGGGWSASIDAYHAGRSESSTFVFDPNREAVPLPRGSYTVLDARIGWQGERVGLALSATNLLDEEYIDRYTARRSFSRILGEPRQVDLVVSWVW